MWQNRKVKGTISEADRWTASSDSESESDSVRESNSELNSDSELLSESHFNMPEIVNLPSASTDVLQMFESDSDECDFYGF